MQEKQNAQQFRYNPRKLPKTSWINRNPRLFVTVTTTAALCIFFSRPLYDIFFRTEGLPKLEDLRKEKARFS